MARLLLDKLRELVEVVCRFNPLEKPAGCLLDTI